MKYSRTAIPILWFIGILPSLSTPVSAAEPDSRAKVVLPEGTPVHGEKAIVPVALFSRTYSTDPNVSVPALTNWAATITNKTERAPSKPIILNEGSPNSPQSVSFVTKTNIRTLNDQLRNYLVTFGVNLDPPKSVFINDRSGDIHIRTKLEDFERIEAALRKLNILVAPKRLENPAIRRRPNGGHLPPQL